MANARSFAWKSALFALLAGKFVIGRLRYAPATTGTNAGGDLGGGGRGMGEGVARSSVLDLGLSPFGPAATTTTVYWVPGFRPVKRAFRVLLVTLTGTPPAMGVAVNV